MHTKETLLHDPEVSEWLATHQGAAEAIDRAASKLLGEQDAVPALRSILPALTDKAINVFFSYKTRDEDAATAVVDLLKKYAGRTLHITYQADFGKEITGRLWRKKIKQSISDANWFILLLPDPSEDWDWCLYETGLFDRQATSADRLICLHHPNSRVPSQIEELQAVAATPSVVEKFLHMVYREDDPIPGLKAVNPHITDDDIRELAVEIVNAIRTPGDQIDHRVFEPHVALRIEHAETFDNADDLDDAQIELANDRALKIFDYANKPGTWGELRQYVTEPAGYSNWREELFHVIRKIAQGRRFEPVEAIFQARDDKFYTPVVHSVDWHKRDRNIDRFHINFAVNNSYINRTSIPEELYRLAAVLRFAFRFRWEVLERFARDDLTPEDIERLSATFERLEKDWLSQGVGDPTNILELFDGEQRERVYGMLLDWDRARNREGSGTLDRAIADNDPVAVGGVLALFLPRNREFLEITTERFADLVQRDTEPGGG